MADSQLATAVKAVKDSPVSELPSSRCPVCDNVLGIPISVTYDEMEKISGWTVAQLLSWLGLQQHSGIDFSDLLDLTDEQPRPGIGADANPTVLGVRLNGMFIGIETDGYTHS